MSKRSASRSTILPLPSSPHWAPMTAITLDICHFLVQLNVLLRGSRPGIIYQHSVVLDLLPVLGPAIKVKCLAYFFKQSARLIRTKLEPSAVAHAVHLIQPARLVQRGHQKHIGAGFDLMRQRLARETLINPNLLRSDVMPVL